MLALCSIFSLIFVRWKHVCSSNTRWASLLVVKMLVKRGFFGYLFLFLQATWQVQVCQCWKSKIYCIQFVYDIDYAPIIVYTWKVFTRICTYIILILIHVVVCFCVVSIYSTVRTAVPCCLFHTTAHHELELPTMSIGKLIELSTRNSTAKTELAS